MDDKEQHNELNKEQNKFQNKIPSKTQSKKSQIDPITIFSIVGMLGIIIAAVIILVVFFKPTKAQKTPETTGEDIYTEEDAEEDTSNATYDRLLAIITNIDNNNKKVYLHDIENSSNAVAIVDGTVDIRDEYGQAVILKSLQMGDIVEVKLDKVTNIPESIKISAKTWERKDISDIKLDQESKVIQFQGDTFTYTDELIIMKEGLQIDISEIDATDELILRGYRDKVWVIEKTNGHGTLQLLNQDKFVGGLLTVGSKLRVDIVAEMEIKVPAGNYEITLEKEGMESFVTDVIITESTKSVIDVKSAQPKGGEVQFIILPEGAKLTINNEVYSDYSKPIPLEYGAYSVVVEKDQFVKYEGTLTVDSEKMDFKVNLVETPKNINVDSPVGAEIYIDANFIGIIPIHSPIDPGMHNITLRLDGYFSKMYQVQVDDDGKDSTFAFPDLIKMPDESTETDGTTEPTEPTEPADSSTNN